MKKNRQWKVVLAATLLSFTSCLKNEDDTTGPLIEPPVTYLYLKVMDSMTGNHWQYDKDSIFVQNVMLYPLVNDTVNNSHPLKFIIDSSGHNLITALDWPFYLLQVDHLKADTLNIISSIKYNSNQEYIDSISVNGVKYAADNNKIITLYK